MSPVLIGVLAWVGFVVVFLALWAMLDRGARIGDARLKAAEERSRRDAEWLRRHRRPAIPRPRRNPGPGRHRADAQN